MGEKDLPRFFFEDLHCGGQPRVQLRHRGDPPKPPDPDARAGGEPVTPRTDGAENGAPLKGFQQEIHVTWNSTGMSEDNIPIELPEPLKMVHFESTPSFTYLFIKTTVLR